MTVEITLAVLVSIASLSFSVYMGLRGNRKTSEKELAERVTRETRVEMKLDEICKDNKEVKEIEDKIVDPVVDGYNESKDFIKEKHNATALQTVPRLLLNINGFSLYF